MPLRNVDILHITIWCYNPEGHDARLGEDTVNVMKQSLQLNLPDI